MNPAARIPYNGALHTFWVSKTNQLWQKYDTADGATQQFNLSATLRLGPVPVPARFRNLGASLRPADHRPAARIGAIGNGFFSRVR